MNIPITKPNFGREEVEAVAEALTSGWVAQGRKVAEFERLFAEYAGARFARATSSCTAALHLALLALGVKAGDEVILPAFTFVSTANAVEYCGAVPVFADIQLATFTIDPARIEENITPRTKAVIPVHEFGLSADMDAVLAIAKKRRLKVVEDAACACGARYGGKHVGLFGDAGCFSFHPRKSITTGEGGMVATNDGDMAALVEVRRSHGAEVSDLSRHCSDRGFLLPEFNQLGYNYRMTDLQGAVGVEQMKKLDWITRERRRLAERYGDLLSGVRGISLPHEPKGYAHAYQSYVVLLAEGRCSRDGMAEALQRKGIATRQGSHAVHALGYYRTKYRLSPEDFPCAWHADRQSLALPLYAGMSDEEQEYVAEWVRKII